MWRPHSNVSLSLPLSLSVSVSEMAISTCATGGVNTTHLSQCMCTQFFCAPLAQNVLMGVLPIKSTKLARSPCVSSAFAPIMRRTCIMLMRIVLRKKKKKHQLGPLAPQIIPSSTASLRLDGTLNGDLIELRMNLATYPRTHFMLLQLHAYHSR